ncbi:unnamed protein product [Brugia timori]|uniref:RGS domain-containing protein n=1 Tax=Brugia timori TaxID=42155 RepID=A0A0R3Q3F3_9BILA|nr:unnamed protein product [Brugia timori]
MPTTASVNYFFSFLKEAATDTSLTEFCETLWRRQRYEYFLEFNLNKTKIERNSDS